MLGRVPSYRFRNLSTFKTWSDQNWPHVFRAATALAVATGLPEFQGRGFNSQVVEWEDSRGIGTVKRSRGSKVMLPAGWQLPACWQCGF